MTHLHGALSPYLEAHRDNPIDWFPWGTQAFERAARLDVPLLISIGYHTCHWCHVMARESFDDPDVGRLVNELMVAIKVDREEHPDVDAHYLAQASAFTQSLGWPLTIFATPRGEVIHAATYLPPERRGGIPSFREVVVAVSEAWRTNRDDVLANTGALREYFQQIALEARDSLDNPVDIHALQLAGEAILSGEDRQWGGFSPAPKFPLAPVLRFLEELASERTRHAAARTLQTMAASDLRDSVEGGFFRYATREDWSEPHYERMLYDNAQLLWSAATAGHHTTAAHLVEFFRSVMRIDGGFASAQDSESVVDGVPSEGGYYLLPAEARASLAPPALDDKVLTGWNGLAIWALARAQSAGVAGDPGALAAEVAGEILTSHWQSRSLLVRMSRNGQPSPAPATLEDYGGLAVGLIELAGVSNESRWLIEAKALIDACLEAGGGQQFVAPGGRDSLLSTLPPTPNEISEGALPSGLTLIADAALTMGHYTGSVHYADAVGRSIAPHLQQALTRPLGAAGIATVALRMVRPEQELIVVGPTPSPLHTLARAARRPGLNVLAVDSLVAAELLRAGLSIFQGRLDAGVATAYLCREGVCELPITADDALCEALQEQS